MVTWFPRRGRRQRRLGGGRASVLQAPGLGEGVLAGASDPRGLRGGPPHRPEPSGGGRALPRHPRPRSRGPGLLGCPPQPPPHPTPSLNAVVMSWTQRSAPIVSFPHPTPAALGQGIGVRVGRDRWSRMGEGTVLGKGVGMPPSLILFLLTWGAAEYSHAPVLLRLRPRTRQRGWGRKCQRVGNTCACAQRSRASKLGSAVLWVCIYPACSGHVSTRRV